MDFHDYVLDREQSEENARDGSADSIEETNRADWLLAGSFEEDLTDRRDNAVNDQRHDRPGNGGDNDIRNLHKRTHDRQEIFPAENGTKICANRALLQKESARRRTRGRLFARMANRKSWNCRFQIEDAGHDA